MFSLLLSRGFRAFARPKMPAGHLNESDIAGFLDGDWSRHEQARIERHLEECAACREAVVDVRRIAAAYDPASTELPRLKNSAGRTGRNPKWVWAVAGTALAASLTFVILNRASDEGAALQSGVRSREPSGYGSRPDLVIASPADDAKISGDSILFQWKGRGQSSYRMTILDETGAPVFSRDTPDTIVVVSTSPVLAPGHSYFWRVDVISDGVVATSPIRTFRVAR